MHKPMWRRYLRFWGADVSADVDNEISFHLEELVKHLRARGLSDDEARTEAARRFGDAARVRAECVTTEERSMRVARRRDARDALSQDARDAFRSLTKNRGFTVGAALILALGIGLNTTSFSFNKALLFPALPIGDPSGIARMWSQNLARGIFATPLSEGDVADLIAANRSFEDVAAYAIEPVTLTGGRDAERIVALRATTNLFAVLRASPALGRGFEESDANDDAASVAILTDRTWRNRFGADPSAVGRDIVINGRPHTIVGVMPERFWFESKDVEVWLPRSSPRANGPREPRTLMAIARFRTGISLENAQADMQALAQRLAREHARTNAGWDVHVSGLLPFGPGEKVFLGLVMTLTSLLLAAACAHIANLLLARGMERRGEIAIRAALGARRGRIVRQLFVESLALSIVGGVCSLLIAIPIIAQIRAVLGTRTPYLSDLSLDAGALAVTGGMTLVASVLFGMVPALRLSSVTAGDAMKQLSGGTIAGRRRSRPLASVLIGLEVAIATFALIITVLYARATSNYFAIPFGFESENIVTFRLDVPEYKYAEPLAAARVLTSVHERLQRLPSIKATGASTRLPLNLGAGLPTEALTIEDRPDIPSEQNPWAITAVATPGYFDSLSIPLVQGRTFDTRDSAASQPVAVISRSMARAYWPENEALGKRFRLASAGETAPWLSVVGVVEDIRPFDPTSPQVRQVYLPFAQTAGRALVYYVATVDSPLNRLQDVRAAVRDVDPELPILDLRTMSETLANQFSGVRLGQASIRVNAVIAVVMAISGVYSVVAFTIARRRREIAVRVALGGTRPAIVGALLRQSLRPALIGVALGLVFSALVSRAASLILFGVDPLDPFTYILTTIALCLAAGAASCIPALKATRADILVALRSE